MLNRVFTLLLFLESFSMVSGIVLLCVIIGLLLVASQYCKIFRTYGFLSSVKVIKLFSMNGLWSSFVV